MKTLTNCKRVIDADNNNIIQYFDSDDTQKTFDYYQSLEKWNDLSIDKDGDIILWEE